MQYKRLILFFLLWIFPAVVNAAGAVVEIGTEPDGRVNLEARGSTIESIVKKIYEDYAIEIRGLEDRAQEKISFSFIAESWEDLLKGLLQKIGVKNYAFEFADATLKRVVVIPKAASNSPSFPTQSNASSNSKDLVSVAQVQSIVEASQAETAGLQEGDLILEYDGVSIRSAQQLVKEVKRKAHLEQIQMVMVRQKITTHLILNGGFIGVRISTKKIPRAEFDAFQ
ncbi:hypothetical protein D1AOALGA4SA_1167 [Olavius algarvensis Delta 1 endosymbiont]|nr:hypothetical protein D1AOALGA4SA_1167 [Olavius algarvensis Delta 1 endosymbiont]